MCIYDMKKSPKKSILKIRRRKERACKKTVYDSERILSID